MKDVRTVNFGDFGEFKVIFENDHGPDTRVKIESVQSDKAILWIPEEQKDHFINDLQELIERYFI